MAVSKLPSVAGGVNPFTPINATIVSGGFFAAGNVLIVNVHFRTTTSGARLHGMPSIKNAPMPLLLYDWASDTAHPGYVNADGHVVVPAILGANHEYLAMGVFVKA